MECCSIIPYKMYSNRLTNRFQLLIYQQSYQQTSANFLICKDIKDALSGVTKPGPSRASILEIKN